MEYHTGILRGSSLFFDKNCSIQDVRTNPPTQPGFLGIWRGFTFLLNPIHTFDWVKQRCFFPQFHYQYLYYNMACQKKRWSIYFHMQLRLLFQTLLSCSIGLESLYTTGCVYIANCTIFQLHLMCLYIAVLKLSWAVKVSLARKRMPYSNVRCQPCDSNSFGWGRQSRQAR